MRIDIPVPRTSVPGDRPRYPFSRLAVGDQIFVPVQRASPMTVRDVVRRRMTKHPGWVFRVDTVEGGSLVVRIE